MQTDCASPLATSTAAALLEIKAACVYLGESLVTRIESEAAVVDFRYDSVSSKAPDINVYQPSMTMNQG